MTKLHRITSKTVIIQPGSTLLRIGLASDEEPKIFLHCIARESKSACPGRIPSLIAKKTVAPYELKPDIDVSNQFGSSVYADSFIIENKFYKTLNAGINSSERSSDDLKPTFIPFLKGLKRCHDYGYQLQWPIESGRFNQAFTQSLNLQNLEDMWTYALEEHLNIPKDTFHLYSVILVIEDVFTRREVRQIVNMLLMNLQFSRIFVQQASVCATYGVGLPTACVIDLGFQKTSISCVDEGISLPDVRIKLPIGVSNCFQTLRSVLRFYSRDKPEILELIQKTEDGSLEDMKLLFNTLFDADIAIATKMQSQSLQAIASEGVSIELASGQGVSLPAASIFTAHLAPYFACSDGLLPEYQTPAIDAPEPDDPFDELYCTMTVREKRRKLQGDFVLGRGDEGVFEPKSQKVAKASEFKNLAEAVSWCIRYAAAATATTPALELETPADGVADTKGDQLRQRLFGCILLVGGGATSLGGFLLSKWLTHELQTLIGDEACVEVLTRPQGVANLAWQGAKLMLNTDSVSDLWLTPAEWSRFGSRLLRERAPFPW